MNKYMFPVLLILLISGCGDESKGPEEKNIPEIQIDPPDENVVFDESTMAVSEEKTYSMTVKNVGAKTLSISEIRFEYVPQSPAESGANTAFSYYLSDLAPIDIAPKDKGAELGLKEYITVQVKYKRLNDGFNRTATLTIKNNSYDDALKTKVINFSTKKPNSHIESIPDKVVDFGSVKEGQFVDREILFLNTGSEVLKISGFSLKGHEGFSVKFNEMNYVLSKDTESGITFDKEIEIKSNENIKVPSRYSPSVPDAAEAALTLVTNDPLFSKDGYNLALQANKDSACIAVEPKDVNFGSVVLNKMVLQPLTITSCGTKTLEIYSIKLGADSSDTPFSLDTSQLGVKEPLSKEKPLYLQPTQKAKVYVRYLPLQENKTPEGKYISDTNTIVIETNTFDGKKIVNLTGIAISGLCPVAKITATCTTFKGTPLEDCHNVPPQAHIKFSGKQSFDPMPGGIISKWEWKTEKPAGSVDKLFPSDFFEEPFIDVNIAGIYIFTLVVYNAEGIPSCAPDEYKVDVKAGTGLHIELLWHTPNDPDETDQGAKAGADVDLHFVHQLAGGPDIDQDGEPDGWFDEQFDCFWFNANPLWGDSLNYDDDPSLDKDDTDGGGPENINIKIPENLEYKVGVHYWNDYQYGISYITLRVYVDGNLKYERIGLKMKYHDMWDALRIKYPGPVITEVKKDGNDKINENYINPDFNFTEE
jgi:hypothetical protein